MPSKNSRRWLNEHFSDLFVKKAKQAGYRSRAAYKLLELQQRYHLFKPGQVVVDLGASPGGWSQVLKKTTGSKGMVIAIDILPMELIQGVFYIQGDFTDPALLKRLLVLLGNKKVDWVVSDMSPNISGDANVDVTKTLNLAEHALEFAISILQPEGGLLVKLFQGEGIEAFIKEVKKHFKSVSIRKPKASRSRSREIYLVAQHYKNSEGVSDKHSEAQA